MKKRDAYHPDYLNMYPCLKERPDILKVTVKAGSGWTDMGQ